MNNRLTLDFFVRFRQTACQLATEENMIKMFAVSSGLDIMKIDFHGSALTMWNSTLCLAEESGKVEALGEQLATIHKGNTAIRELLLQLADGSAFIKRIRVEDYLQPLTEDTPRVMYIYDPDDSVLIQPVLKHFKILEMYSGELKLVDPYDKTAGNTGEEEQLKKLFECSVVLLMFSSRFMTNPDCCTLAFRAVEAGRIKVIPVLIDTCDWRRFKPLAKITPLPTSDRFLDAYEKNEIEKVCMNMADQLSEVLKKK